MRSLRGHVDRHDAAGQIFVGHVAEPGFPEDLTEPFLIRERTDRRREVLIDTGFVPSDFCADPRQQSKRVPVVECAKPSKYRPGEFKADEPAVRLHHPADLAYSSWQVSHIAHAKAGGHRMKGIVGES